MKSCTTVLVFLLPLLTNGSPIHPLTDGHQKHQLSSFNDEYVVRCPFSDNQIPDMFRSVEGLDVWSVVKKTIDIRIVNEKQNHLVHSVIAPNHCEVLIPNLNALLHQQDEETKVSLNRTFIDADNFFYDYQSYASIVARIESWSKRFPGLAKYIPSIGQSIEGRDIPAVKITNFDSNGPKKAIWWNSGQHAREWIGPATILYIGEKLLSSNDTRTQAWLDKFEFYITPVQNPDGYEFTRTPGNRFWRKNRRKNKDGSYGVDLNRNWDEHWSINGSSNNPRSDTYHGTAPFSEPETKALSDFIMSIPNRYAGIDFHSYSQLVLRNWGWTYKDSKNEDILKKLGDGMSNAIYKASGAKYTSEKGADLYPAAGATDDWMSGKAKMVGYTIELRDTGRYGFALPPSLITTVGEEIWQAMLYFIDFILENEIAPNEYIEN